MLSQQQIAHFQAFGFVVLHGLLDDGRPPPSPMR